MIEILRYQREDGREPFTEWLDALRDKAAQARIRVRLRQVQAGTSATANQSAAASLSCAFISALATGCIVAGAGGRSSSFFLITRLRQPCFCR